MKKRHVFIIIGQSIVIVLFAVYAFVQQAAAQRAERDALAAQETAQQAQKEAEMQKKIAEQNAMEAMRQAEEARRQQKLNEDLRRSRWLINDSLVNQVSESRSDIAWVGTINVGEHKANKFRFRVCPVVGGESSAPRKCSERYHAARII